MVIATAESVYCAGCKAGFLGGGLVAGRWGGALGAGKALLVVGGRSGVWGAGLVRMTCPCCPSFNSRVGIFSRCRKALGSQGKCSGMWGMGPACGRLVPADLPVVVRTVGFGSRLEQTFLLLLNLNVLSAPFVPKTLLDCIQVKWPKGSMCDGFVLYLTSERSLLIAPLQV